MIGYEFLGCEPWLFDLKVQQSFDMQMGVSRGWGSIIVWGTADLEQSEQRKKDRR